MTNKRLDSKYDFYYMSCKIQSILHNESFKIDASYCILAEMLCLQINNEVQLNPIIKKNWAKNHCLSSQQVTNAIYLLKKGKIITTSDDGKTIFINQKYVFTGYSQIFTISY